MLTRTAPSLLCLLVRSRYAVTIAVRILDMSFLPKKLRPTNVTESTVYVWCIVRMGRLSLTPSRVKVDFRLVCQENPGNGCCRRKTQDSPRQYGEELVVVHKVYNTAEFDVRLRITVEW